MFTELIFRDLEKTETLEAFLMAKTEGAIADFFKRDPDAHLTVRVEQDRHRNGNRKPHYTCEVVLKPTRLQRTIKVKKSAEDFFEAVSKTALALKAIARKQSSLKASHGRHRHYDRVAA